MGDHTDGLTEQKADRPLTRPEMAQMAHKLYEEWVYLQHCNDNEMNAYVAGYQKGYTDGYGAE